ncbi:hypothetical protein QTP70_014677, partial [Hemibagrus guttatus]
EKQQQPAREPYGLNLSALPRDEDLCIYHRFSHLGRNQHKVERNEQMMDSKECLENVINLAPVSLFGGDSIYEVSAPRVDLETQNIFRAHIQAGLGGIKTMCREDIVIYREYVRNRYM